MRNPSLVQKEDSPEKRNHENTKEENTKEERGE
jgi:hypothetical protein